MVLALRMGHLGNIWSSLWGTLKPRRPGSTSKFLIHLLSRRGPSHLDRTRQRRGSSRRHRDQKRPSQYGPQRSTSGRCASGSSCCKSVVFTASDARAACSRRTGHRTACAGTAPRGGSRPRGRAAPRPGTARAPRTWVPATPARGRARAGRRIAGCGRGGTAPPRSSSASPAPAVAGGPQVSVDWPRNFLRPRGDLVALLVFAVVARRQAVFGAKCLAQGWEVTESPSPADHSDRCCEVGRAQVVIAAAESFAAYPAAEGRSFGGEKTMKLAGRNVDRFGSLDWTPDSDLRDGRARRA